MVGSMVRIGVLPNNADLDKLKKICTTIGPIRGNAHIKNGYAFVEFEKKGDAHKMIETFDGVLFINAQIVIVPEPEGSHTNNACTAAAVDEVHQYRMEGSELNYPTKMGKTRPQSSPVSGTNENSTVEDILRASPPGTDSTGSSNSNLNPTGTKIKNVLMMTLVNFDVPDDGVHEKLANEFIRSITSTIIENKEEAQDI